jgi:hypothetical protein
MGVQRRDAEPAYTSAGFPPREPEFAMCGQRAVIGAWWVDSGFSICERAHGKSLFLVLRIVGTGGWGTVGWEAV